MRLLYLACSLTPLASWPNLTLIVVGKLPVPHSSCCEAEHDPEDAWAGEGLGLEDTDEELDRPAKRCTFNACNLYTSRAGI